MNVFLEHQAPEGLLGIVLSTGAGVATAFGAFLVYSNRVIAVQEPRFLVVLLSFASGASLFVATGQLLPAAHASVRRSAASSATPTSNPDGYVSLVVSAATAVGVMAVWLIDALCRVFLQQPRQLEDSLHCPQQQHPLHCSPSSQPSSASPHASLSRGATDTTEPFGVSLVHIHDDELPLKDVWYSSGFAKLVAFTCQNVPEGFAIYAALVQDQALGIVVAVSIILFNLAECLAITGLLCMTATLRWRAVLSCALSGLASPLGGLAAWWLFQTTQLDALAFGLLYATISGIQIGMVLTQVLPVCYNVKAAANEETSVITLSVFGGMLFSGAIHMLLAFASIH